MLVSATTLFKREATHPLYAPLAVWEAEVLAITLELLPSTQYSPPVLLHPVVLVPVESSSGLIALLGELGEGPLLVLKLPMTVLLVGATELVLLETGVMLLGSEVLVQTGIDLGAEVALDVTLEVLPSSIHPALLALHAVAVEPAIFTESLTAPLLGEVALLVSEVGAMFVGPKELGMTLKLAEVIMVPLSEVALLMAKLRAALLSRSTELAITAPNVPVDGAEAAFALVRTRWEVSDDPFLHLGLEFGMLGVGDEPGCSVLVVVALHVSILLGPAGRREVGLSISVLVRTVDLQTLAVGTREVVADVRLPMVEVAVSHWDAMLAIWAASVELLDGLVAGETLRDWNGGGQSEVEADAEECGARDHDDEFYKRWSLIRQIERQ